MPPNCYSDLHLLLLLGLWRCGQGASFVHHIHGPPRPVGLFRRSPVQGEMGPLGVVETHPFADDPLGLEAVGELMQVDGLILERAPQALNEDVVHAERPRPSMEIATPASFSVPLKSKLVNCGPDRC